jgi:hypothetical protein
MKTKIGLLAYEDMKAVCEFYSSWKSVLLDWAYVSFGFILGFCFDLAFISILVGVVKRKQHFQ